MPVYNAAETVQLSIKSVLNQTYQDFDFIIINDGSTDSSENIILSFNDNRIKYFKIPHKGLSSALNYGLSHTFTKHIARIDSDDLFFKDKLMKQMDYLLNNPEIDIIFTWSIFYKNSEFLRFWKSPEFNNEIKNKLKYLNPINHSSVVFKRDVISKLSGYNEDIDTYEDYELWLRASKTAVFHCLPEYLVFSKLKEKNVNRKFNAELVKVLYEKNENTFPPNKKETNDLLGRIEYYYGDVKKAYKLLLKGHIINNFYLLWCSIIVGNSSGKIRGNKLSLFFSKDIIKSAYYRDILKSMTSEN